MKEPSRCIAFGRQDPVRGYAVLVETPLEDGNVGVATVGYVKRGVAAWLVRDLDGNLVVSGGMSCMTRQAALDEYAAILDGLR